MRLYARGLDILGGDAGTGGAPSLPVEGPVFGPPSPEDLSKAKRPLTPAETQAVYDWWHKDDAKSATTSSKAVAALGKPSVSAAGFFTGNVPGVNMPLWQVLVGGFGVAAVGAGIFLAVKR